MVNISQCNYHSLFAYSYCLPRNCLFLSFWYLIRLINFINFCCLFYLNLDLLWEETLGLTAGSKFDFVGLFFLFRYLVPLLIFLTDYCLCLLYFDKFLFGLFWPEINVIGLLQGFKWMKDFIKPILSDLKIVYECFRRLFLNFLDHLFLFVIGTF